ncbi:Transposase [anaerobic digester metagenome]|jgi:transposase
MNNVAGVDVSKGKSMVSVLRPFGEVVAKSFTVRHTSSELKELADYLKSLDGETRVVMEHTGRYYESVAQFLYDEGIFVSAVNPKLIKALRQQFSAQGQDRCSGFTENCPLRS